MTILTKPSNEKKSEKVPLPLGGLVVASDGQPLPSAPLAPLNGEPDAESMVFNRRHISASTTIFLFLSALAVMLVGILGGVAIYGMYAPAQRSLHYRGTCDIPYYPRQNMSIARLYAHPELIQMSDLRNLFPISNESYSLSEFLPNDDFFREDIELDLTDDESYSKIDVPDFKDGRRGRFMHDFKENQSAIIDTSANRCFVMPLDRETTLPPKNFFDLMQKMGAGYYNIDTDRIRMNMRVVTPELTDMTLISQRIANECYDMKVYLLERYISGVFKREARLLSDSGKFAEFSGKKIVYFNLMNIDDIEGYEAKQKK
ncbi:integral membrane protein 2B [Episyrphus balteatus]|uniref:integral membrane protein 2B n=1 Tax=Episyrphus balteatus TaxID=286459 RepID=UPI002486BD74|nr:integral membrane protein 2B [Episyrphus balteatus]